MKKVTNIDIMKSAAINKTTYYKFKKHNPRQMDLIQKGVIAEMILDQEVFDFFLNKKQGDPNGIIR